MNLQEISKSEDVKFLDEVTSIRKAANELKGKGHNFFSALEIYLICKSDLNRNFQYITQ